MTKNKFLALVYADLFDFPLTSQEFSSWQINSDNFVKFTKNLLMKVDQEKKLFFLPGRSNLVTIREKREKASLEKTNKAAALSRQLKRIPTIEGIYLTGSVAAGNASKDSDIDLMIICLANTLWLTRLVVVMFLKVTGEYRTAKNVQDRFCTNLYLDLNNLRIKEENLFTAHEILQAKCLFDKNGCNQQWLNSNQWTKKFLPFAQQSHFNNEIKPISRTIRYWQYLFSPLEIFAFGLQFIYMFPKISQEKIGWGYAFFHPKNLSGLIEQRFLQRLLKLSR